MEEIKSKKEDEPRRRTKATVVCRETRDHVHRPRTRPLRNKRPHHAPSPVFESIFGITRKTNYGQCMKNQAADIGATSYDGCGEFVVPTTGEESLNCGACGCHRRFHTEQTLTEAVSKEVLERLKISSNEFRQIFCSPYGERKKEGISGGDRLGGGDLAEEEVAAAGRVKRFKSKFTEEQKEKMKNYGERLGWKINPENRNEVDEFCVEIGLNLKQFRVWMNNHKG